MVAEILSKEIETYQKNKQELLSKHNGKFVLIKEEQIVGIYDTQADAVNVGIDKFGNTPFLVKKIQEVDSPQNFTSNLIKLDTKCLR